MAAPEEEWEDEGSFGALQSMVNEMLVRLEEVESVMTTAKHRTEESRETLADILEKKDPLYKLCKRIDDLEHFIDIVENQLADLGKQVETAEHELGISGNKIKSMLQNVFRRSKSEQGNIGKDYVPMEIFSTENYIKSAIDK